MRVQVKGKPVDTSPALESYAEKRLQKLEKYFHRIKVAEVTTSVQRNWHTVEVLVEGDGVYLRAEERCQDMYEAVDLVSKKLEHQVRRFKGKLARKPRDSRDGVRAEEEALTAAEEAAIEAGTEETEEEAMPEIVRQKSFAVKPMAAEEAAEQMELLNHGFFVFLNAQTEQVNVIYRRRDGNYGLIEPSI
ncbi:MAG TPA: ribosome-associated translation inhibitor RaiA [Armatimonadota bacterium]